MNATKPQAASTNMSFTDSGSFWFMSDNIFVGILHVVCNLNGYCFYADTISLFNWPRISNVYTTAVAD